MKLWRDLFAGEKIREGDRVMIEISGHTSRLPSAVTHMYCVVTEYAMHTLIGKTVEAHWFPVQREVKLEKDILIEP